MQDIIFITLGFLLHHVAMLCSLHHHPFRIRDKWATIGDDDRPWHIHLNLDEVVEARFVKEPRSSDARQSYSIRFFDSTGHLSMRANFIKLYDNDGKLIIEKAAKFDEIYVKHGRNEILSLRGQQSKHDLSISNVCSLQQDLIRLNPEVRTGKTIQIFRYNNKKGSFTCVNTLQATICWDEMGKTNYRDQIDDMLFHVWPTQRTQII